MAEPALLAIEDLRAWYGESQVLHGVRLEVPRGQVTTLLGRNGAGKTSTLRAIMGLVGRQAGSIRFAGEELCGLAPDAIARRGIAWCPEQRGIFPGLTVEENLLLPPVLRPGGMSTEEVYALFPNLRERRRGMGTRLSGGEQQMLAIGRILRTGAQLLLLDEPTEGLAPVIVQQIANVVRLLRERGFTILLVEQSLEFARQVSDRFHVIEDGRSAGMLERSAFEQAGALERLHEQLSV